MGFTLFRPQPHRKKSQSVRSGERRTHSRGSLRAIHWSGNLTFRKSLPNLAGLHLVEKKKNISKVIPHPILWHSKLLQRHQVIFPLNVVALPDASRRKNGPIGLVQHTAHQTTVFEAAGFDFPQIRQLCPITRPERW